MKARLFRTLIAIVFVAISHATRAQQAPEYRTWTDRASGKTIEAAYVSADATNRTVTILSKDGRTITLAAVRFVDADLAYIKTKLAAPPAPAAAQPPPAPAPAPAAADTKTTAKAGKAAGKAAAPVGQPAPARPAITVTPAKKFKLPPGNAILGAVQKVRPRMILNAAGFEALKARAEADPASKTMLASIKATGEKILALPELVQVRGEAARGGSDPGTKMLSHVGCLGVLNYAEGDPRWKEYMVREMVSISSFTNWHPEDAEVCAQFVWAMSLGYDWFRSAMSEKDNVKIKEALVQLGIDGLAAHLKREPPPPTTKRPEPGTTSEPAKKAKGPPPKKPDNDEPVSTEDMIAAAALMHAAIALADDLPNVAGPAASIAAKTLDRGLTQFAPDGIWLDGGVSQGDKVLDILGSLVMTLRAATGGDFGISSVEGLPQAGDARVHLAGPMNSIFNYGDATGDRLTRPWVASFLSAFYGNPGYPALKPPGPTDANASWLSLGAYMMYHNPHIAGFATPATLDRKFDGAQVATLRSAWNDPKAWFVGVKGGKNELPGAQLDLGTFVLDAGGVRWAIDLGTESDRVAAALGAPSTAKYTYYRENSHGQNTWQFGGEEEDDKGKKAAPKAPAKKGKPVITVPKGCQSPEGEAKIIAFDSTPERGVAVVDLSEAWSPKQKDFHRGVMVNRSGEPYVLIQDELTLKSKHDASWVMHTRADVVADGNKATLTSGGQTLTLSVLSPAGASVVVEELKDEDKTLRPNDQVGSFKGIKRLRIAMASDAKGPQTVAVAFTMGDTKPAPVVPIAQWIGKKR